MVENALLVVGAFLVGSIPTGYLVSKYAAGIDIRDYGSGNAGASNVIAHVGMWIGAAQGLFDCLVKGALPVLVGSYIIGAEPWAQGVATRQH
jgi:glycerol-3-phosphate acyltransferase PlsY